MEISGVFLCKDMLIEIVEYLKIPEFRNFIFTCRNIYELKNKFYINDWVDMSYRPKRSNFRAAIMTDKYFDSIQKHNNLLNVRKLRIDLSRFYYSSGTKIYISRFKYLEYLYICYNIHCIYATDYEVYIGQNIKHVRMETGTMILNNNCYINDLDFYGTELISEGTIKNLNILYEHVSCIHVDATVENLYINREDFLEVCHNMIMYKLYFQNIYMNKKLYDYKDHKYIKNNHIMVANGNINCFLI